MVKIRYTSHFGTTKVSCEHVVEDETESLNSLSQNSWQRREKKKKKRLGFVFGSVFVSAPTRSRRVPCTPHPAVAAPRGLRNLNETKKKKKHEPPSAFHPV